MENDLRLKSSQIRRAHAETSLLAFTKIYLAEYIPKRPSPAHEEIDSLLMELTHHRGRKLAIAAPRGFGKTTLVTLAYVLYGICYAQEKFIVLLSSTSAQAIQLLETVKEELTANQKLLTDFPELGWQNPRLWTDSEIVTATSIRVLALGAEQRVRGRKYGKDRPTLVIADDLENAESAFSLESLEQLERWFTGTVLMAGGESTNFIFIGSLYHINCLLADYTDPKIHVEWTKRVYKALCVWASRKDLWDQWSQIYNSQETWENGHGPDAAKRFYEVHRTEMDEGTALLWPERWTYYDLMVQREEDPVTFNSELQNEPVSLGDCLFNLEELTYWDDEFHSVEDLVQALGEDGEFYGACDFSVGQKTVRGAYAAIVILALNLKTGLLYVIEADIRRCAPTETIEKILAYYQRYPPFRKFAVDAEQFQDSLAQYLERRGRKLGLRPPIEKVQHPMDDIQEVQVLHSLFKDGTVRFSRKHTLLLEQLRLFPQGRYRDGPDALGMAVRSAEGGMKRHRMIIKFPDDDKKKIIMDEFDFLFQKTWD